MLIHWAISRLVRFKGVKMRKQMNLPNTGNKVYMEKGEDPEVKNGSKRDEKSVVELEQRTGKRS